jgi:AraC family transcriptional regulator
MVGPQGQGVTPEQWVRHLGGETLAATDGQTWRPLSVGRYRFPERPDPFTAPPLERHYVSMTFEGDSLVERKLHGDREHAHFGPGRCLIMGAGQENAWRWDEPLEEVHFYLCPEFLSNVAQAHERAEVSLLDRFAFDDAALRHLAGAILAQVESGADDPLWVDTACQLFAAHLLGQHCEKGIAASPMGGLSPASLRRVKEMVAGSLNAPINLESMGREAGVSRFHFARMFRESMGVSPYRWVQMQRIERARELLRDGTMSLAEIAVVCGFSNQSHFGRVFRDFMGTAPAAWRRNLS